MRTELIEEANTIYEIDLDCVEQHAIRNPEVINHDHNSLMGKQKTMDLKTAETWDEKDEHCQICSRGTRKSVNEMLWILAAILLLRK